MKSYGLEVPASLPQLEELAVAANATPTTEVPQNTTSFVEFAGPIAIIGIPLAGYLYYRRWEKRHPHQD